MINPIYETTIVVSYPTLMAGLKKGVITYHDGHWYFGELRVILSTNLPKDCFAVTLENMICPAIAH